LVAIMEEVIRCGFEIKESPECFIYLNLTLDRIVKLNWKGESYFKLQMDIELYKKADFSYCRSRE